MRVADVCDAVVDDGRELDQRAEAEAPDGAERRAQADVRLRLRAVGRRAVHRPLQLGAVDADRHLPRALEVLVHGARAEAGRADGHVQGLRHGTLISATPVPFVRALLPHVLTAARVTRVLRSPSTTVTTSRTGPRTSGSGRPSRRSVGAGAEVAVGGARAAACGGEPRDADDG